MYDKHNFGGVKICQGGFVPAAANSSGCERFSEYEEMRVHASANKFGGTVCMSKIGEKHRIDVFISAKDKAFGNPAFSVSKRAISNDVAGYSIYIRHQNADIPTVSFEQAVVLLDRTLNCSYDPALPSTSFNKG